VTATIAAREHPILFTGPMVRAILHGTKTQTRRVVLPQPCNPATFGVSPIWGSGVRDGAFYIHAAFNHGGVRVDELLRCPWGQPSDRLWVRETHALEEDESRVVYAADREARHFNCTRDQIGDPFYLWSDYAPVRWRPSIFFPRWAARLTPELTGVRVERVQSISEEDAIAEGLSRCSKDFGRTWKWGVADRDGWPGTDDDGWPWDEFELDPRAAYRKLWDRINAKRGFGWDANPYVWVLSFTRVTA
jgi:hypothetical protein